ETTTSPRAVAALAPSAAVTLHAIYERSGAAVDSLPGGAAWRASIESVPQDERHLEIHEGHLVAPNRHDTLATSHAGGLAGAFGLTGTQDEIRTKIEGLAAAGVTEIAYQPAGPDIPRELEAFARAAIEPPGRNR